MNIVSNNFEENEISLVKAMVHVILAPLVLAFLSKSIVIFYAYWGVCYIIYNTIAIDKVENYKVFKNVIGVTLLIKLGVLATVLLLAS